MKYGDPNDLQDYKGGRDLESLKQHVEENIRGVCSPITIDTCDEATKKLIQEYQAMDAATLDKRLNAEEIRLRVETNDFESLLWKENARYEKIRKEKALLLGLMRASRLSVPDKVNDEL